MKKVKSAVKNLVIKYGAVIASCAFAFVAIAANSACVFPYYEPEEPTDLEKFKKYNRVITN